MIRYLAASCVVLWVSFPAYATEVHGETDLFSGHGVTLAWAVARGADEARTFVVVRVVTEPSIRAITVKGRDPFTKAERVLVHARPTTGRVDIRLPRAGFADHPRTEWGFHGAGREVPLVVFYLGVPDTTPEFAEEARLEAYLDERVAAATSQSRNAASRGSSRRATGEARK